MISAIFQTPTEIKQVYNFPESNYTDAKIMKIAFGIFAAISFAIGYLALTVGTGASYLLAIPTLAIGGCLTWIVLRIKDYQDPKQLEQYRNEAATEPLSRTISKHGWENMFKYEIPRNIDFDQRYSECIERLPVKDFIAFYENAASIREKCVKEQKLEPFELPEPVEFNRKFDAEVEGLTACEIFGRYDFDKLLQHHIISQRFYDACKEYTQALQTRAELTESVEQAFAKNCADINEQRSSFYSLREGHPKLSEGADLERAFRAAIAEKDANLKEIEEEFNRICSNINRAFAG